MSATIKYKGATLASITTNASKTLKTSGKYCEGDIVVENVQDGGITPTGNKAITATTSTQTGIDVTSYATVSVEPTPSETKSVTTNGDVTPSSGKLLSKVTVNVPQPVLKEFFPPKCVYVAQAKVKHSAGGNVTIALNPDYKFTTGALKKSTLCVIMRNDGTQFGNPSQAFIANDYKNGTYTGRGVATANSSSSPTVNNQSFTTVDSGVAFAVLRGNTEHIVTIYYSDADAYTGTVSKIPIETLVNFSCSTSGTFTITDV